MENTQALVRELYQEAVLGVRHGREESLREAPHIEGTLGFKPDIYTLKKMPIYAEPMEEGVLGVTHIMPDGKAVREAINIPYIMRMAYEGARLYGRRAGKRLAYWLGKETANHEDYHVMSAHIARGEEVTPRVRDAMESITTRGRYKVAKTLGNYEKAEIVKKTNPYPMAWKLSEIADRAPYEGPSGTGYKGFLADSQVEKFYKPFGRLAWAAAKSGWRKTGEYISGFSGAPALAAA